MLTLTAVRAFAARYHIDPADAEQEWHLWHLTGRRWTEAHLRSRIRRHTCGHRCLLDAPITSGQPDTHADAIRAPVQAADATERRVWRALRHWERASVLTRTQRALLWLRYGEGLSGHAVAALAGCHHTTLLYHERQGLERIRRAVAAHEQEGG